MVSVSSSSSSLVRVLCVCVCVRKRKGKKMMKNKRGIEGKGVLSPLLCDVF